LNVLDFVKFAGRIGENDMPVYLASSDVYVSTSLSESGLAASTAEAMACGLPVINTDTGDIGRWLTQGEGGFIIPPGDAGSLAEKVISVLTDDGMREKAGQVNRRVIVERLNYFTEMAAMETIYIDLAANRVP
jgi:glycosyltransferase involved in cell wall biosynthesis